MLVEVVDTVLGSVYPVYWLDVLGVVDVVIDFVELGFWVVCML